MAVTFGNITAGAGGGLQSAAKPSGLAVGDLMIAYVTSAFNGATQTWTPPDGFDAIQNAGNGSLSQQSFWKVATQIDVDATTFVFTGSAGGGNQHLVLFYLRGADGVIPSYVSNTASANNTVTTTGLTPSANSMLIIIGGACENGFTSNSQASYSIATSNPSWTEQYDTYIAANYTSIAVATAVRPQSTATGTSTVISTPNTGTIDMYHQLFLACAPTPAVTMTAGTATFTLTGNDAPLQYTERPDITNNTSKPSTTITNTSRP